MNVDESDFGRRYAELSDEALLSVNREDLIDTARQRYDQELARRGLRDDRAATLAAPSTGLSVADPESDPMAGAFRQSFPAPVRILGALFGNFLVAALGTALAEGAFYGVYHPASNEGRHLKELIISVGIAFLLGCFVYYRWQWGAARWIWVVGVFGLIWLLAGSWGRTPFIPDWVATWGVLSFVSVRAISYSAGAWLCAKLILPFIGSQWTQVGTEDGGR